MRPIQKLLGDEIYQKYRQVRVANTAAKLNSKPVGIGSSAPAASPVSVMASKNGGGKHGGKKGGKRQGGQLR